MDSVLAELVSRQKRFVSFNITTDALDFVLEHCRWFPVLF
jgi:hypothetical protein